MPAAAPRLRPCGAEVRDRTGTIVPIRHSLVGRAVVDEFAGDDFEDAGEAEALHLEGVAVPEAGERGSGRGECEKQRGED